MGQVLSNISSNILCGEEAEYESKRPSDTSQLLFAPTSRHALQAKPSRSVGLQTLLSSSPSLDSCSNSSQSYVLNPLNWSNKYEATQQNRLQNQSQNVLISSLSSELLGYDSSSEGALKQAESFVSNPPQLSWSNKSRHTGENQLQNQPQDLLISSSSSELLCHGSSADGALKRAQSYVSNPPRLSWSNKFRDTEHNRLQHQPQDILISSSSSESLFGDDSSLDGAFQRDLLISLSWLDEYSCFDQKKQVIVPLRCEEEEEEEKERSKAVLVIEEIWMKHYSSRQKILLVGEGDFSFSASLAVAFGSATNIIATSLDSIGFLSKNYGRAMSNIHKLRIRGAKVFHDVDATEMANLFMFEDMTFDRIIFNFPHAGIWKNEPREKQLREHRNLVRLFMANAKRMIGEDGEIHVTHKSNDFFREWNLMELGSSEGLQLIEEVHFNFKDYPGYSTKFGFGGDMHFNCNPSKTYKFGLQIRGWW